MLTYPEHAQVREMRLVRREDARGVCLVLLRFSDADTAAGFYDNYNGRPVSSPSRRSLPGTSRLCTSMFASMSDLVETRAHAGRRHCMLTCDD